MTDQTARISVKPGREKPILNQHPWIFSGAIHQIEGAPEPGAIVTVTDKNEHFLACGYWNPNSQIRIRLLTWVDEEINTDWWRQALKQAIDSRQHHVDAAYSCRLINAENDFLPGLIVDRYVQDDGRMWLVLQALTLGIEQRKAMLVDLLNELLAPTGIYERSDVDVRRLEGLPQSTGLLSGDAPTDNMVIINHPAGPRLMVNIANGHKTGAYLDQQSNHQVLTDLIDTDPQIHSVLNLFGYTGGFGLSALYARPELTVTNVDRSLEALELAEENFTLNDLATENVEFIQADVFEYLRDMADADRQFDCVILDPPKFAHTKQQIDKAARGYKDINLNAFRIIRPGGYLMTFSCSGAVSSQLFNQIVFGALADSGRRAQILRTLGAGSDHPIALTFPEGAYLKGLLLRVF